MTFVPSLALLASVVQKMDTRTWVNTLHGAVLGGVFLALTAAAFLLVVQLRPRDLTSGGLRVTLALAQAACVAVAVAGWLAVVTGTFGVDRWFIANVPTSPSRLLEAHGYGAWVTAERVKEVLAWASAVLATAAALLALRARTSLYGSDGPRRRVAVLLAATLALGSVAGLLGVLLTKLAPLS